MRRKGEKWDRELKKFRDIFISEIEWWKQSIFLDYTFLYAWRKHFFIIKGRERSKHEGLDLCSCLRAAPRETPPLFSRSLCPSPGDGKRWTWQSRILDTGLQKRDKRICLSASFQDCVSMAGWGKEWKPKVTGYDPRWLACLRNFLKRCTPRPPLLEETFLFSNYSRERKEPTISLGSPPWYLAITAKEFKALGSQATISLFPFGIFTWIDSCT